MTINWHTVGNAVSAFAVFAAPALIGKPSFDTTLLLGFGVFGYLQLSDKLKTVNDGLDAHDTQCWHSLEKLHVKVNMIVEPLVPNWRQKVEEAMERMRYSDTEAH